MMDWIAWFASFVMLIGLFAVTMILHYKHLVKKVKNPAQKERRINHMDRRVKFSLNEKRT